MLHSSSCQAHLDKKHPCSQAFSCLPACVCVCVCTYEIYLHVCVRWCTLRYCVYRQKAAGAENAIYFSCIASGLHEISQKTTIVILSEKKNTFTHMQAKQKKRSMKQNTVFTHFVLFNFFMHLCFGVHMCTCKCKVCARVCVRLQKYLWRLCCDSQFRSQISGERMLSCTMALENGYNVHYS